MRFSFLENVSFKWGVPPQKLNVAPNVKNYTNFLFIGGFHRESLDAGDILDKMVS